MSRSLCSSLRISTVTGTASLGYVGDLDVLYSRAQPSEHVSCIRSPDGNEVKPGGTMQTLPKTVGRHLTLIVRINDSCIRCHAKVYANGTVHVTGVKSASDIASACCIVSNALALNVDPFDIRTRMINAFCSITPVMSRRAFVDYVCLNSNLHATFDPAISNDARIYFCFDSRTSTSPSSLANLDGACSCSQPCAFMPARMRRCHRVIAIIHSTGTVMMSGGGCAEEHLIRATTLLSQLMSAFRASS